MGKRRLAYTVRRFHDGVYVAADREGGGGLIHDSSAVCVSPSRCSVLTVRIDEEQKRLDKIKRSATPARRRCLPGATPEGGETTAVTA